MDWTAYFSPFLSVFFALIQFSVSELTPEQCRELGFSVNLLCSSCDELKPFNLTSEPSLEANCRKCCHADEQEEATKVWIALFRHFIWEFRSKERYLFPFRAIYWCKFLWSVCDVSPPSWLQAMVPNSWKSLIRHKDVLVSVYIIIFVYMKSIESQLGEKKSWDLEDQTCIIQ